MSQGLMNDLQMIVPELILAVSALVMVVIGAWRGEKSTGIISWLALAVLVVLLALFWFFNLPQGEAFNGLLKIDSLGGYAKSLVVLSGIASIIMMQRYGDDLRINRFELPILILLSLLGMMIMVSAHDFLTLYVGLELQSLCLYILASFNRDNIKSAEAGLKYFVLGILASGLLLYGISLIYGFAGTTGFDTLGHLFEASAITLPGVTFGLVLICVALAFKIAAAPFHMWTPDVYQGAPTPVTGFFAIGAKAAAVVLCSRVLMGPLYGLVQQWQQIIIFMAVASLVVGAFAALVQQNLKRLLGYSAIGHVGFLLIGLAAASASGLAGVMIYLTLYLFMSAGVFTILLALRRGNYYIEEINELRGLSRTHPKLAFAMAVFMFSFAGVPPASGFFAKLYVLMPALDAHLVWLAVAGVIASVVAAYYYLRIIKIMYFDEPEAQKDLVSPALSFETHIPRELAALIGVALLVTVGFIFYPAPFIQFMNDIAAGFMAR